MKRYDEYVKGNDTPKTLCNEIDELKKQISLMKCCGNCTNYLCCLSDALKLKNDICEKWEFEENDD